MKREDPIDRGRMQIPFLEWEREAEKKRLQALTQTAEREAAAQEAPAPPIRQEEEDREQAPDVPFGADDMEREAPPGLAATADIAAPALTEQTEGNPPETGEDAGKSRPSRPQEYRNGRDAGPSVALIAELLIFAALLCLASGEVSRYPLPVFLQAVPKEMLFTGGSAVLLALAAVFAACPLAEGFVSLFTLRRKTSAACALAFLGGVAGFVPAAVNGFGAADGSSFYALSACACLALETLSRLLAAHAGPGREAMPSSKDILCSAHMGELEAGGQIRSVVFPGQTAPALGRDRSPEPAGRAASVLSLVVLALSVAAVCVDLFWFGRPVWKAAVLFASAVSAGAPLVMGFSASLPLCMTGFALRKRGAFLSGYGAVQTFGRADALFLPERLLYPDGQVKICALRPMSMDGLENAALAAASVASAAHMAMAPALSELIENAESLLRPVECLRVIDEMGVEARVDGKRVLLGSRNLLRQKQVDLTGRMLLEVEAKYAVKGNDFVYLVVGEKPMALLVLDYTPGKKLRTALRSLTRTGVKILIGTADANITREQVAEQFRLKKRAVRLIPYEQSKALFSRSSDEIEGALYVKDDAASLARALSACVRLDSTMHVAAVTQVIGAAAGIALAFLLCFAGGRTLAPLEVLTMQAIWAIPAVLLAVFRRHI